MSQNEGKFFIHPRTSLNHIKIGPNFDVIQPGFTFILIEAEIQTKHSDIALGCH